MSTATPEASTAPSTEPEAEPGTEPAASTGPPRSRRRRVGQVLLAVGVLVLALIGWGVIQVVTSPSRPGGPGDGDANGHSALGALVRDEGLSIVETDTFGEVRSRGPGDATVVITRAGGLDGNAWQALLDLHPGRIVLVAPTPTVLERIGLPVRAALSTEGVSEVAPGCDDPAAQRAGTITVPHRHVVFSTTNARSACYAAAGGGHLHVVLDVDGVEVVLTQRIGSNDVLALDGNASLAMQTVGAHPSVLWWFPRSSDTTIPGNNTDDGDGNPNRLPYPSLLPPGWLHAVGLAAVALVVVAVWRGRRLGPVLTEDLPSVVPAAETVEGHGRLYGRLSARDTAAEHLRAAAITRLARVTGHADDTEVLAHALAGRTGWSYGEIRHLLDGPAPTTDEQLVILKRKLDALEQEARRP